MKYLAYATKKVKTYRDLMEHLQKLDQTVLDQDIQVLIDQDEFLHPKHIVTIMDSDEVKDGQIAIAIYY